MNLMTSTRTGYCNPLCVWHKTVSYLTKLLLKSRSELSSKIRGSLINSRVSLYLKGTYQFYPNISRNDQFWVHGISIYKCVGETIRDFRIRNLYRLLSITKNISDMISQSITPKEEMTNHLKSLKQNREDIYRIWSKSTWLFLSGSGNK